MSTVEVKDAGGFAGPADRVIAARSAEEAAAVLREASSAGVPVAVAGSWTGLAGGAVPEQPGGWVLEMGPLKAVRVEEGRAIAGAGATLVELQAAAKTTGQFYAPDPTEITASVGGTIATNASGSRSFLYKATRNHVLGLTVAFLDGSVRTFRRGEAIDFPVRRIAQPQTTKHSVAMPLAPGMDWVDLFIGSEGILGVVVEAELRLLPIVKDLLTGVLFFESEEAAWSAVTAWRGTPGLRMLEYIDSGALRMMETQPGGAQAALIIEQELRRQPEDEEVWVERMEFPGLLEPHSWIASGEADRERFRKFRHSVPERVNATAARNGFMKLGSDCAVPLEQNESMLRFYRELVQREFPGQNATFGHIGDAHVHVNVLPRTTAEFEKGREVMTQIAREAASRGGSVSAEHGLGKRKRYFLSIQYSEADIAALREVKHRFDPLDLLGRGNLLPPLRGD